MANQGKTCYVCGCGGYMELLIDCSECSDLAVHAYCLGIVPGSADDSKDYYWACYYCGPPVNSESSSESENQIIPVEEQPKPLCTLPPVKSESSSDHSDDSNCVTESPAEIMSGVVLLVSPTGEISILDDSFVTSVLIKPAEGNADKLEENPRSCELRRKSSTVKKGDQKSSMPECNALSSSKRVREMSVCRRSGRMQRRRVV